MTHTPPYFATLLCALAAVAMAIVVPTALAAPAEPKVKPVVPLQAQAFALEDVRLLDGPFKHAMELDRQYLLSLEPDRLLHTFRINAGIPTDAKPLGGWEAPKCELRGHFVGHYLSGCALMYAATGDARLKEKGDAVVAGLAQCQEKLGASGYLSAFPEEFFDRVEKRERVWAPYYTLHKIYAGLLDMYIHCGNAPALDVCRKFADWVIARNAKLTDEQMEKMLGEEHGGMNEVLANLYAITGEEKYLKISLRFNHQKVIEPASHKTDKLTGLHANTQIPKFIGTARQFELTGQEPLKTASLFFWQTVARERSYVIGGHSDGEYFTAKEKLSRALGPNTTETCNTYNMLKLTGHLFTWDTLPEYADFAERATINHILASQDPKSGGMCYYVPLRAGSRKNYGGPLDAFWCCTGTGVENHARYGEGIYFHADKALFVNLFIASEVNWKSQGVTLRQETGFPAQHASRITVTSQQPAPWTMNIRRPYWAAGEFAITINGELQKITAKPGEYVALQRTWKTGDVVQVLLPFSLRIEAFKDNPRRFAFMYGPLVLCAQVDTKKPFPALVADPAQAIRIFQPSSEHHAHFTSAGSDIFRIPGESACTVVLEPFYTMHGKRNYVVYWDAFTLEEWKSKEAEYAVQLARIKELEGRTIDLVHPGNEQNERDHHLTGERTGAGDFGDRHYRDATDGGHFAWDVKLSPDQPQELWVTYWGSDGGNRVFDILLDGKTIATQRLERKKPDQFYDERYPLPADLTRGKQKATLRFQAQPGNYAGGVFEVRIVRSTTPAPQKP